jgi:type IV secretory pathway VirJ component
LACVAAAVLAALLVLPAWAGELVRSVDMAEFGTVRLFGPVGAAKGFAVVFSDAGGLGDSDRAAIQALAARGLAVAAVDSRQALQDLDRLKSSRACIDLLGPLEWLSSNAEHDLGLGQYRAPLLFGRGAGAALVYAALAQAPPQALAGGVSVDFLPEIALGRPLCHLPTALDLDGRQLLSPQAPLGAGWFVGTTSTLTREARAFAATVPSAAGVADPATLPPGALAAVYDSAVTALTPAPVVGEALSVGDLPLVEVAAKTRVDTLAVIYSGDGGWRDLDKEIGDVLAARGMAVVGVDSLRYFWSTRTPEEVGADLARVVSHYIAEWHVQHVVLVGYSFGADVLPFAYNGLPADLQGHVSLISLLAPGRAADFEIQALGWLGAGPSGDARPIPPETARLDHAKVQCFFGTDDADDSLCTHPAAQGMEVIGRPGGHHFAHDYQGLAQQILAGACRRGIACAAS